MEKKKILFVIHRLDAGGAEKSLVSLLNSLPLEKFEVDLLALDPTGIFRDNLPDGLRFVNPPGEMVCQHVRINEGRFWRHVTFKTLCIKLRCIMGNHARGRKSRARMCHTQYYNAVWKRHIPDLPKKYDVAVSYLDGMNYYVIDHVCADKKILWCHNDYNKLDLVPAYDRSYYAKADKVCTISDVCLKSLIDNFPSMDDKLEVVENISSPRIINAQADMTAEMTGAGDGFADDSRFRLVSIGRLVEQKGFDIAIDAARILKDGGLDFAWYILGEGELRKPLEERAKAKGVDAVVKFIGVRANPYPYIKYADLFVMPSRYEGKSIALDEAKILCKPIVVTSYPSVGDAIESGRNGLIVDIDAQAIACGIMELYRNETLRSQLGDNLRQEDCGNESQVVGKFLKLMG